MPARKRRLPSHYTRRMGVISFARGVPAPECLPLGELAECARAAIVRDGATVLSYGDGGGYPPLREWIGERHGVDPGRVLVTNGSLQGFIFLARRLLAGGEKRVLVEAPTYDRPLKLLRELGAEIVGVPVDEEGLDVDAVESLLRSGPRPAFLYVIPTFQNPSGRTLTVDRRIRLVELARRHELIVLEDDPYGLVRFEGESPPSLRELDGGEHVIYTSSFSKTIAPGVRVGYLIETEADATAALASTANSTYISPALLGQATVLEFLRRGHFEPNLRRVCALLKERRDAMLGALAREFPEDATWSRPEGGYFVWLDFPAETNASDLLARAGKAGVTFVRGSDFFADAAAGRSSARLAFSFVSAAEVDEGIARLAALIPAGASRRPVGADAAQVETSS